MKPTKDDIRYVVNLLKRFHGPITAKSCLMELLDANNAENISRLTDKGVVDVFRGLLRFLLKL